MEHLRRALPCKQETLTLHDTWFRLCFRIAYVLIVETILFEAWRDFYDFFIFKIPLHFINFASTGIGSTFPRYQEDQFNFLIRILSSGEAD